MCSGAFFCEELGTILIPDAGVERREADEGQLVRGVREGHPPVKKPSLPYEVPCFEGFFCSMGGWEAVFGFLYIRN